MTNPVVGGPSQPVHITGSDVTLGGGSGDASAANQAALNTLTGAVTETAPASDTASSGLNGRLQRIAQRLTSLLAKLPALGTAGTPSTDVITVQGATTGTPLPTLEASRARAAGDYATAAANTAAVITYAAAGVGVAHVIGGVVFGYNATPTAGLLTITDGTSSFIVPITASGPGPLVFPRPMKFATNTQVTITLAAGGASVVGYVNSSSHWTE